MYRKGTKTIGNVYEEVALLFRSHNDLLDEFTYFLPDNSTPSQVPQPIRRPANRTGRGPARGGPSQYPDQNAYQRKLNQRKVPGSRMDEYRRYADDVEDRRTAVKTDLTREVSYFDKIKQRIRSREQYQDFLKTLNLYSQEIISRTELNSMIFDILGRNQDLMVGFHEFLNRCEVLDSDADPRMTPGGKVSARDVSRMKAYSQMDKYASRPVSELDVSSWERCSTSYVRLPQNYPRLRASAQTQLGEVVLQDAWVSVTSGSEDYSFKHMRKNQYEEALFRCEDDRFELDMAIERNASTIRALQPLVEAIQALPEGSDERVSYRPPPQAISPIHMRSIVSLYADQGAQIRDLLDANPVVAIPVVLFRLQQKDREWRGVKENMAPMWARIYESNYHKSLDHRSFYFKQTDKRNLGAKAMLNEIRDIVEKRKATDGTADVPAAAPAIAPSTPDLQLPFHDRLVHEDLFQVMKYAFEESVPAEVAQKCLDFWSSFVEPFFGLPTRPKQQPTVKSADKEGPVSPGGVKKMMSMPAMSGELDGDLDGGLDSEMPSAEAGGETVAADMNGEVASALGVLTGAAKVVAEAKSEEATPPPTPMEEDEASPDAADGAPTEAACAHCKPLAPAPQMRSAQTRTPETGRVLCGHDAFYIFLRLHHHLYERLWRARKCAIQKEAPGGFASTEIEVGGNAVLPALDGAPQATHVSFMRLLSDLIDGNHDASAYEDACRALLGTNSYVLFTLDKLIYKMLVESDGTEGAPGLMEPAFADYLRHYTSLPAERASDRATRLPFMRRLLPVPRAWEDALAEDSRVLEALKGAFVANGLECKLSCSSSKVSYVLDTEDIFCRTQRRRQHSSTEALDAKRRDRFHRWLDTTDVAPRPPSLPAASDRISAYA
ncbi:hypothetical protein WJX73_010057 [Symbiochloris irregularis]|uniref:Histone deacetylase interacting domain-containing protein n=1 Tax=Symbiochloris irregularis TaxID=706552 RepID=A0AAW1PC42_9CHLO